MRKKRNIIMGQSGGPTSVINSSLTEIYKTAKEGGFYRTYGMLHGIEDLLDEVYVDLSTRICSDMGIELLKRTSSTFLGSCRYKLPDTHENPAFYERIFAILGRLDIEVFIYIGGNGSMDAIKKLSDYAVAKEHGQKFLGAPKTIDNDLALTNRTPGFGSAAKYIATSAKEMVRDTVDLSYHHKTIAIMEYMGRNAGWLTDSTALAGTENYCGPDLIYLPEIPFDIDEFLRKCKDLVQKKPSVIIAVSEGTKVPDGRHVCQLSGGSDYMDAFGHRQLTRTADYPAGFLTGEPGCKTRSVELPTLQRSTSRVASRVDIGEALVVGSAAVKTVDEGDIGEMMVVDRVSDNPHMSAADVYNVHKIANNKKTVPRSWVSKNRDYVTREFVNYMEPLIQGDYQLLMISDLPQYLVLKR